MRRLSPVSGRCHSQESSGRAASLLTHVNTTPRRVRRPSMIGTPVGCLGGHALGCAGVGGRPGLRVRGLAPARDEQGDDHGDRRDDRHRRPHQDRASHRRQSRAGLLLLRRLLGDPRPPCADGPRSGGRHDADRLDLGQVGVRLVERGAGCRARGAVPLDRDDGARVAGRGLDPLERPGQVDRARRAVRGLLGHRLLEQPVQRRRHVGTLGGRRGRVQDPRAQRPGRVVAPGDGVRRPARRAGARWSHPASRRPRRSSRWTGRPASRAATTGRRSGPRRRRRPPAAGRRSRSR